MTNEKKGIVSYLVDIPARHIYLGLLILVAIPLLVPLNIPPKTSPDIQGFYDTIENLPEGSRVLLSVSASASFYFPDLEASVDAILNHLFIKEIPFVVACFHADAGLLLTTNLEEVLGGPPGEETNYDVVYGVDYVNLGFLSKGEPGMRAYYTDVMGCTDEDLYGDLIADMPLMNNPSTLVDVESFDLVIIADCNNAHNQQRQLVDFTEVPKIAAMTGGITGEALPYISAGAWEGYLAGAPGAFAYEILQGIQGKGHIYGGVVTTSHTYLVLVLVVGNIAYLLKRREGGN